MRFDNVTKQELDLTVVPLDINSNNVTPFCFQNTQAITFSSNHTVLNIFRDEFAWRHVINLLLTVI